jgi:hypothetical protein
VHGQQTASVGEGEGSSREGEEGNECIRADAPCPRGCSLASMDGKNPSVGKTVSAW